MRQKRILIVDDDVGIRQILAEILTRAKYQVEDARDGAEALLRLKGKSYDLITMDLAMEGMDGLDTIAILRNESSVPILAVSAQLTAHNRAELTRSGVTSFLDKPFTREDLLEAVESASRSRAHPL